MRRKKLLIAGIAVVLVAAAALFGVRYLLQSNYIQEVVSAMEQFSALDNGFLEAKAESRSEGRNPSLEYLDATRLYFTQDGDQLDYVLIQHTQQDDQDLVFGYKQIGQERYQTEDGEHWVSSSSTGSRFPAVLAEMIQKPDASQVKSIRKTREGSDSVYLVVFEPGRSDSSDAVQQTVGYYKDITYTKTYTVGEDGLLKKVEIYNKYRIQVDETRSVAEGSDVVTLRTVIELKESNSNKVEEQVQ